MVHCCIGVLLALAPACAAFQGLADPVAHAAPRSDAIRIVDRDIFPESVTTTRSGTVIIGSLSQHYIYRARPGSHVAERWIDLSSVESISYGVLADEQSNTLWACTLSNKQTGQQPPALAERHSSLRAFDLATGAVKGAWPLPGANNSCNDVTIAPDGSPFVSDIGNQRILRLSLKTAAYEQILSGPALNRVDGVAFIGNTLFFSCLDTGAIYRLENPLGGGRKFERLSLSQPLRGPDGMRVYDRRLYIADNSLNQILVLSPNGSNAQVDVLISGLKRPTGVAPMKGKLWFVESKTGAWVDPQAVQEEHNPFFARSLSLVE